MAKKKKADETAPQGALTLAARPEQEFTHEEARWYNVGILKKSNGRTAIGRRYICYDDQELEQVEEFLEGGAVGRVLIAPLGTTEYQQFVEREASKYDKIRRRNGGQLPSQVLISILHKAWAKHILLDWEDIALQDGSMPKYSPEVGVKVAKDSPDFREEVMATAGELADELSSRDEEDAEDLGNDSSGS